MRFVARKLLRYIVKAAEDDEERDALLKDTFYAACDGLSDYTQSNQQFGEFTRTAAKIAEASSNILDLSQDSPWGNITKAASKLKGRESELWDLTKTAVWNFTTSEQLSDIAHLGDMSKAFMSRVTTVLQDKAHHE